MARRATIVAALILLFSSAHQSGLLEMLGDRERASSLLESLGLWGPALYVLGFALLEPFFVPGVLFVLGATALWPFWIAFGLSLTGAIGAGIVGFSFARFMARDWVEARLPERFRRYDEALAGSQGFRTVVLLRLIFFIAPPANWVLGLSRVRFTPFVVGSALGFAPMMAVITWLCLNVSGWLQTRPPASVLFAAGVALCSLGLVVWWIRRRRLLPDSGI